MEEEQMTLNKEARMIDPAADAMSDDYKGGLIAGYHECGYHISKQTVFNDTELERNTTGCKHAEWCEGYANGYIIRRSKEPGLARADGASSVGGAARHDTMPTTQ